MADRNWLLNPSAIHAAKACIYIVQEELGVKIKLSHPQFIEMLKDYVELTDSPELEAAYHRLVDYAGSDAHHLRAHKSTQTEVGKKRPQVVSKKEFNPHNGDDVVIYKGKAYKRFNNGKEFRGLYRGQARYA